jgi:hypothetical protein
MPETASLDVSQDHLVQFVAQLSHESRATLLRVALSVPIDEDMLEQCTLEELNIGQLESGQKPRFICPHVGCNAMFAPDTMRIISFVQRTERPARVVYGNPEIGNGVIEEYASDEADVPWKRAGYICGECGKPITLPAKWTREQY